MKIMIIAMSLLAINACEAKPAAAVVTAPAKELIVNNKPGAIATIGQVTNYDTLLVLLTYGMPVRGAYGKAVGEVAAKYGFRYMPAAGCVVSRELIDCVRAENEKTEKIIAVRQGENWKEKFDIEVAALVKAYNAAGQLAANKSEVAEKKSRLEKQNEYMDFDFAVGEDNDHINVEAFSYKWENDSSTRIVYFNMIVDLKTSAVFLIRKNDQ